MSRACSPGPGGPLVTDPELLRDLAVTAELQGRTVRLVDDGTGGDAAAGDGRFTAPVTFRGSGKVPVRIHIRSPLVDRAAEAVVEVSGTFRYTGGPIDVDLGNLGVDSESCRPLALRAEHQGEVPFELVRLRRPPSGHRLEVRVPTGVITPGGDAVLAKGGDRFEICLKTSRRAPSSLAAGEPWLELRVAGSEAPGHRVTLRLRWKVEGLSFWQRWGWLILGILLLLLLLFLIAGYVLPQRFQGALALVYVPDREELDEQTPQPVKQWRGVRIGFYRNARAFLHPDFRLSGNPQGALASLHAERGGAHVMPGRGLSLFRETLDADWEGVPPQGRRVRAGDVYRIGDRGPYLPHRHPRPRVRQVLGLVLALLGLAAGPAAAAHHVRVVLDLSQSMRSNDPGRLAVLSVLLLHDLAQPNSTMGDSFDVIPFHPDWHWRDPDAPPPADNGERIQARFGQRAELARKLQGLRYDARMTYFHPGLAAALQDLEQQRGGAQDVRIVVLVTDGVPEPATRDAELRRIRDELLPRFEQGAVRLYVLAFGAVASQNRDFFDELVRSRGGAPLGELFVDPQGRQILAHMLEIFSRSFGYSPDAARALPSVSALDLDGGATPERVAVAVLSTRPQPTPSLRLTPPAGGSVNFSSGVLSASESGASYSLFWVLSPSPGAYGFDTDAPAGSVAVLRPTRLVLEVLPRPPQRQSERALAGTPFPLRILVRSPTGASGDPGPVDLSFRTLGERVARPGSAASSYTWEADWSAPPPGLGTASPRGRTYDIMAEFREHPERPGSPYAGYLEVQARRGEAVVGLLAGPHAHRVEVHPPLTIAPLPLSSYASSSALERRQSACTRFTLHLNAGRLPHPERPRYAVRTVLRAADRAVLDRELKQASFALDGQPLELEGRPGPQPAAWYKGRPLDAGKLLGEHEICVRIGKPMAGDPARPLELETAFTLLEDPYDDFRVVQPFTLKVLVAPPTFLERWRALFLAGLALFALLALLWYLRDRPILPADLAYALGPEGSTAPLEPRPLAEASGLARLCGLAAERPVVAPGEERALGHVRPDAGELFRLRPASGVRIEAMDLDEAVPLRRGLATLAVHSTYRLRTERGSYLFRLEYR